MNTLPVISSVRRAFIFAYESHRVWIQYAMIVMLIKAGCVAAAIMLDMTDMPLRAAFIYLPATLAEGLFAGFIVKLSIIQSRKQGTMLAVFSQSEMQACMIIYTLIHLTIACIMTIGQLDVFDISTPETDAQDGEQTVSMVQSFFAVIAFMAGFWLYRVAILYIPIAMGVSARRYMRAFNKFGDSLWMMATSLMVIVPPMIIFVLIVQTFLGAMPDDGEDTLSMAQLLVASLIEIPFGMVILVLNSAALAFLITPRLKGAPE